jgi:cytochrome c553
MPVAKPIRHPINDHPVVEKTEMNKLSLSILAAALAMFAVGSAQAGGVVAAGKTKSESCVDCHGDDGKGDDDNPSIAGMAVDKFTKAMGEYQAGTRTKSQKMIKEAKKLSAQDIADLAAYYATLPK